MGQGNVWGEEMVQGNVQVWINGNSYKVPENIRPETSLNVFIREHAGLKGTKSMCLEGGCGACIVSAEIHGETLAVNSCLVPILICNGWKIKTVEGIGNKKIGYHKIQTALAHMNGSQCGFCSPGMVMNMYSLLQNGELSMKEIENSFGSNICRCTGYRPILEAFKGFANDADPALSKKIHDIEELYKLKTCPKSGKLCQGDCSDVEIITKARRIHMQMKEFQFHKVLSIEHLFGIFEQFPKSSYILNGGNTAHGVYRMVKPEIYVDINDIPDLHRVLKDSNSLTLGGNVSLNVAMNTFEKFSKEPGFGYLSHMANHIDLIASVPIRNIGTLAGNLMIKHQHREFPSDLFLILEAAGALIHILDGPGKKNSMTLLEFLNTDMNRKIIYSIVLSPMSNEHVYRSYKIMPRAQNAHAHVNAGFLFKLDGYGKVLERPNIIIGGINESFLHATETEKYLENKVLLDKKILSEALKILDSELKPDHKLPDYTPEFRKLLATGLFYKFVLSVRPDSVDEKLRSGSTILQRELSSASHDYDTDKNTWPINKPLPKMESIYQTSGEGEYINDICTSNDSVHCAFVHAEFSSGKIANIDASVALTLPGVVAFFTAADVPGKNLCIDGSSKHMLLDSDEKLFAEGNIEYAGQPVGVIVAETHALANEAAKMVKVTYSDTRKEKAIVTIQDVIASGDKTRLFQTAHMPAKRKGNDSKHVIKGEMEVGSQYHFTMEPQSCVCVPTEDGMDVYPASQWMDLTQVSIASCLGVPNNSINISVRRLGGGYGAKISRSTQVSCACAMVCHLLNRPARFVMTIESNMTTVGKRYSMKQQYEIGVDDNGLVQYLNSTHWGNAGCSFNELHAPFFVHHFYTCYDSETWTCDGFEAKSDIPSNTFCRAPASTEAVGMAEHIMEHVARVVGKDPLEVRILNMNPVDKEALVPMIEDMKKTSDYEARKRAVAVFNGENRWKKKGISFVVMKYPLMYWGQFQAMVSIYARDGTVSVVHGGIECGQGIHTKVKIDKNQIEELGQRISGPIQCTGNMRMTKLGQLPTMFPDKKIFFLIGSKVAQVAAHTLGIDLNMVSVKPSNTMITPNNSVTGGSITSESCAYATMMACRELNSRLEPIKAKMEHANWKELIMAASAADVELCARYMMATATKDDHIKPYPIYGVTVAEVELDLLTGQHMIQRVDIMEDAGVSLNPEIDLGQVEGAFVMGIGYWTSEDLIYDPNTGLLTNNRTWNYKPPGAKDIPVDFRVSFRRNAPNLTGVLRSKATGEPPLCMSVSVPLAIRNALNSARMDAGNTDSWYRLDGPITTEKILLNSLTKKELMVL